MLNKNDLKQAAVRKRNTIKPAVWGGQPISEDILSCTSDADESGDFLQVLSVCAADWNLNRQLKSGWQ